ncbi:hypothetical protein FN846DRAFT_548867 [Sphaerosporella brunnea]|uniref:C2H2-type domain-containing protein n=1 Tax=Sphaerosporella brunnea TaxID=1250544 RepID=A0A5J5EE91_9PEZI|nr:hypothetical protein FN846DRAFT_548840 [Sphaerosporella brunnea]KAA8893256.1 hypothetical protein FN846DRAFT_548867 [Sphaerosporella brunnea]
MWRYFPPERSEFLPSFLPSSVPCLCLCLSLISASRNNTQHPTTHKTQRPDVSDVGKYVALQAQSLDPQLIPCLGTIEYIRYPTFSDETLFSTPCFGIPCKKLWLPNCKFPSKHASGLWGFGAGRLDGRAARNWRYHMYHKGASITSVRDAHCGNVHTKASHFQQCMRFIETL